VTGPRFRIAWAMGFVALVALDLRMFQEMYNVDSRSSQATQAAILMSNVLVVGLLIRHRRPRSRRFLSGFVVAGAMALAVVVAVHSLDREVFGPYLGLVYRLYFGPMPFFGSKGIVTDSFQPPLGTYYLARSVLLTLPQLAFALVGGLFFRAIGNLRAARPNRC
jgi:hypothetical protein